MAKAKQQPMNPVERAIWLHGRAIDKLNQGVRSPLFRNAQTKPSMKVKKSISKRQVLMDALYYSI